jgi:hypothetical protein
MYVNEVLLKLWKALDLLEAAEAQSVGLSCPTVLAYVRQAEAMLTTALSAGVADEQRQTGARA